MASSSTPVPDALAKALHENQELRNSLQAANEQLQQFLYATSHDLQEPLRGIIAYAQLLDRQAAAEPANREYTAFILDGALRMRELLQALLVYSRAGASKSRKSMSLNVPLQMALLKLTPQISSASTQIVRHPLPEAIVNETELAQVFEHLLSNSLKFHSEAPLEIVVSAEQGTDDCTVTVRDNGIGVDPRFCEQVLLPFKRLHGNEMAGNGLGLAICHKIIRAHGGRLWVESDGERGASVHFTLPS